MFTQLFVVLVLKGFPTPTLRSKRTILTDGLPLYWFLA